MPTLKKSLLIKLNFCSIKQKMPNACKRVESILVLYEQNMAEITVSQKKKLRGKITVPADKSISHRAMLLSSLAEGKTNIENFLEAGDCLSTVSCLKKLGANIKRIKPGQWQVHGKGKHGFREPLQLLDAGNSGTTARILSGILAGCDFTSILTGDESLCARPMKRVTKPLRKMGAEFYGRDDAGRLPILIAGKKHLKPVTHSLDVASAQVKSALLLAGLFADGVSFVKEPAQSRDHTERMLKGFGVRVQNKNGTIAISGDEKLRGTTLKIPGDISSAAFFIAAALLCEKSELHIKNITLNPTRTGILSVLKRMGANIKTINTAQQCNEPAGDIFVETSRLKGCRILSHEIPSLIDEIPILCVLATQAHGTTVIRNAKELRVKETDRIKSMTSQLKKMGAEISELEDGMVIHGPAALHGTDVESFGDHRTAMSLCIAGLAADGETTVHDTRCISISFPSFEKTLSGL